MSITVLVENSILLFFSSRTSRLVKSNISGKHQGWVGKIKHYQVGWGKSRLTSNITKLTGKHYQTLSMLQCFRKKSWVRVRVQNGSTKP